MLLRVLSLNVWGLPDPVGRDVGERMHRIVARIPGLGCSVLAFQEVWSAESRQILVEGCRALGYDSVWHREATQGGSGLLVLSKLRIRSADFTGYVLGGLPQRVHHADYFGNKGFARLEIGEGEQACTLFATHMQARYAPGNVVDEYRGHRVAQVIELAAAIRATRSPVVAVGDFNLRESSPEYRILTGLCGLVDAGAALGLREQTAALDNIYRIQKGATGEARIDYVFTRSGRERGARAANLVRVLDEAIEVAGEPGAYSDHYGLTSDIEIGGPGGPIDALDPAATQEARTLLLHGVHIARTRRRNERIGALVTALAAGGLTAGLRRSSLSRRRLLRIGVGAAALAAGVSATGFAALSEIFVPEELEAYARVLLQLENLSAKAVAAAAAVRDPAGPVDFANVNA